MGNEASSLLHECAIDEGPILRSEACGWALHHARLAEDPRQHLSVFVARDKKSVKGGGGQQKESALQMLAKGLRAYRHPKILRYISDCSAGGQRYLFTEKASPLPAILSGQHAEQILLGLRDVAEALQFLHERGRAGHNGVGAAAIFVSPADGRWKLGGLENVKRFEEESTAFLDAIRNRTPACSIPPEDRPQAAATKPGPARDIYGYGALVREVLKGHYDNEEDLPGITDFFHYAEDKLMNADPGRRPPDFRSVLDHPIFRHAYLSLAAALDDLPAASLVERRRLFSDLVRRLHSLKPEPLATQFCHALLSRAILIDSVAKERLLPSLLTPSANPRADYMESNAVNPVFPEPLFRAHLAPVLLRVWRVRDYDVRQSLLAHFSAYVSVFSKTELQEDVLPHLLLGIRDDRDDLVAATLRALADLVPVLGASVVVGRKGRRRVFADGSPGVSVASKLKHSNRSFHFRACLMVPRRRSPRPARPECRYVTSGTLPRPRRCPRPVHAALPWARRTATRRTLQAKATIGATGATRTNVKKLSQLQKTTTTASAAAAAKTRNQALFPQRLPRPIHILTFLTLR